MPSYDYDGTVASIAAHRREAHGGGSPSSRLEHLQKSVELFSTLSALCPMTPLLWMQYADDAADVVRGLLAEEGEGGTDDAGTVTDDGGSADGQAAETRLNILELAVSEFPGCALLRLRHLEAAVAVDSASSSSPSPSSSSCDARFDGAMSAVGRGSHRNEDGTVARMYRLHVEHLVSSLAAGEAGKKDERTIEAINASYVRRAETPMRDENDSLSDEIGATKKRFPLVLAKADDEGRVEEGRRCASRMFGSFANLEDEVDVAMAEEGIIMSPPKTDADGDGDGDGDGDADVDWYALFNGSDALEGRSRYLMGLGGARTAAAFAKYAGALSNRARRATSKSHREDADEHDDDDNGGGNHQETNAEREGQLFSSLATSVYERGVSECPTVESLWAAFVQHVLRLVGFDRRAKDNAALSSHLSLLNGVCARSVRNCPYSVRLFGLKMKCLAISAEVGSEVFDPDRVMAVATEATEGGFLPTAEARLEVHAIALRIVRQRIMALACATSPEEGGAPARAYDDSESMEKTKRKKRGKSGGDDGSIVEVMEYNDLNADAEQEVQDLIEDSREMYDATDSFFRKSHPSWTEGRAVLWSDRARAEAYVYSPLLRSLDDEQKSGRKASDEAVRCFEKSVRLHQPPHPDMWMAYIHYIQGRNRCLDGDSDPAGATAAKFRKVRSLFQRSMTSVKKQRSNKNDGSTGQTGSSYSGHRDYSTALFNLCHEYLEFERMFGSDESYGHASKATKGKLHQMCESAAAPAGQVQEEQSVSKEGGDAMEVEDAGGIVVDSSSGKRKLDANGDLAAPAEKRLKLSTDEAKPEDVQHPKQHDDDQTEKKTNLKVVKRNPEHKVRINNFDYPAHPFTVRASNLSLDTEDMDLVDTFGPKCGAIVHARILRDKHQHRRNGKAKSKGCGLIQFEERDSVEKALELDGVLGLHDKLVKVERSHIPAANIVPPGMHRVNPEGEGRSTKRNQKRKGAGLGVAAESVEKEKVGEKRHDGQKEKAKGKKPGVLAFRPRGLHGQKHHKVKIDLAGDKK